MKYFFIPKSKDGMWHKLYFCQHDVHSSLCFDGLKLCVRFVPRPGPARWYCVRFSVHGTSWAAHALASFCSLFCFNLDHCRIFCSVFNQREPNPAPVFFVMFRSDDMWTCWNMHTFLTCMHSIFKSAFFLMFAHSDNGIKANEIFDATGH